MTAWEPSFLLRAACHPPPSPDGIGTVPVMGVWAVKLRVADPSLAVRHPGQAVTDALIDLGPVLRVDDGLLTVTVDVDAETVLLAESEVERVLVEADVVELTVIVKAGPIEPWAAGSRRSAPRPPSSR